MADAEAPRYSWTQPICGGCYGVRQPGRVPSAIVEAYRATEICCDCGLVNRDGIYLRVDPTTVAHPTTLKD